MAFEGIRARQIIVSGGGEQFLFFGPFRNGDIVSGLSIGLIDPSFASSQTVPIAYALFNGTNEPLKSKASFQGGRQLCGPELVVDEIPSLSLPVGIVQFETFLPIFRLFLEPTWVGLWVDNNGGFQVEGHAKLYVDAVAASGGGGGGVAGSGSSVDVNLGSQFRGEIGGGDRARAAGPLRRIGGLGVGAGSPIPGASSQG